VGTLESSADDGEEESSADDIESSVAGEESAAESKTLESSPVDPEDPVDAVSDETALCVTAVAEAVDEEGPADSSNANVSATSAASVAVPVAIRVRRVEVMAPVVTGDLKSSVRVRLRRHEAGWIQLRADGGR
jgi:hypothetical protein